MAMPNYGFLKKCPCGRKCSLWQKSKILCYVPCCYLARWYLAKTESIQRAGNEREDASTSSGFVWGSEGSKGSNNCHIRAQKWFERITDLIPGAEMGRYGGNLQGNILVITEPSGRCLSYATHHVHLPSLGALPMKSPPTRKSLISRPFHKETPSTSSLPPHLAHSLVIPSSAWQGRTFSVKL